MGKLSFEDWFGNIVINYYVVIIEILIFEFYIIYL